MAPPELPRDAPVADLVEPALVLVGALLGVPDHLPRLVRLERAVGERLHAHEPLHREERLHDRVAALAVRHLVPHLLRLLEEAHGLELHEDLLPRLEAVEPLELAAVLVDPAVLFEDVHHVEVVALPDLEVVGVVAGRHLERARAHLLLAVLHVLVGDDLYLPVHEGEEHRPPHEGPLGLVLGVHGHRGVAEHRLGPRRRDRHEGRGCMGELRPPCTPRALERILDVVEVARDLLRLGLLVREGRLAARTPVHEALAPVDEALLVELHEHLAHGARELGGHRELLALPVAGGAQRLELLDDRPAALLPPLPHALDELLAAQVEPGLLLLLQLLLHHVLRRDPGVVRARDPARVPSLHAAPARDHVLEGVVERVAHVEHARHVGRRDYDAEGRPRVRRLGVEDPAAFPLGVPAALHLLGVEALVHLLRLCRLGHGGSVCERMLSTTSSLRPPRSRLSRGPPRARPPAS